MQGPSNSNFRTRVGAGPSFKDPNFGYMSLNLN